MRRRNRWLASLSDFTGVLARGFRYFFGQNGAKFLRSISNYIVLSISVTETTFITSRLGLEPGTSCSLLWVPDSTRPSSQRSKTSANILVQATSLRLLENEPCGRGCSSQRAVCLNYIL